jgi:hypothetical protein
MMMKSFRATLAAAAIALVGLAGAGTAAAKPAIPLGPNKLVLKLCHPHYETKVQFVGYRKIGHRWYRLYKITKIYVDKLCRKHVVSVRFRLVPVYWYPHRLVAPAA